MQEIITKDISTEEAANRTKSLNAGDIIRISSRVSKKTLVTVITNLKPAVTIRFSKNVNESMLAFAAASLRPGHILSLDPRTPPYMFKIAATNIQTLVTLYIELGTSADAVREAASSLIHGGVMELNPRTTQEVCEATALSLTKGAGLYLRDSMQKEIIIDTVKNLRQQINLVLVTSNYDSDFIIRIALAAPAYVAMYFFGQTIFSPELVDSLQLVRNPRMNSPVWRTGVLTSQNIFQGASYDAALDEDHKKPAL